MKKLENLKTNSSHTYMKQGGNTKLKRSKTKNKQQQQQQQKGATITLIKQHDDKHVSNYVLHVVTLSIVVKV